MWRDNVMSRNNEYAEWIIDAPRRRRRRRAERSQSEDEDLWGNFFLSSFVVAYQVSFYCHDKKGRTMREVKKSRVVIWMTTLCWLLSHQWQSGEEIRFSEKELLMVMSLSFCSWRWQDKWFLLILFMFSADRFLIDPRMGSRLKAKDLRISFCLSKAFKMTLLATSGESVRKPKLTV